jgi:hypothetical protein
MPEDAMNVFPIQTRRGVTLIFVVSLIVLFLLMGTAFVVLSTDFLRTSRKRAQLELHTLDPEAYLGKAFYDLVREPDLHDAASPLRGHSLLGDMYGYGFKARIASAQVHGSQQFFVVRLNMSTANTILDDRPVPPPAVTQWAGLVLTIVSGPSQGLSTRIVDHQIVGNEQVLLLQPEWRDTAILPAEVSQNLAGAEAVINGRPFSGTGAGRFDPQQPSHRPALSATALQPDQRGRTRQQLIENYLSRRQGDGAVAANHASTNESYDTFDFQNMFLAGITGGGGAVQSSFHRPDLAALSPVRSDLRAITGPDNGILVDNLNNGSPDGVWLDIGLPAQTSKDGTRFKPLVSYTVIDLDSRINLNAHGHQYLVDREMTEIDLLATQGMGTPDSESLHRGVGYGPPEIRLAPVLSNWDWVFNGNGSTLPGRYGEDGKPGEAGVRDGWAKYKLFGYPDRSFLDPIPGTVSGDFGSVMDAHGRFAIGYPDDTKDFNVPVHLPVANVGISNLTSELVDSAYELSFADPSMPGPPSKFDQPFTLQELEAVLRIYDLDSRFLPPRLKELGGADFTGATSSAYSVTTSSFEVPTRMENLPQTLAQLLMRYDPSFTSEEIREQIQLMLPSEVIRGLPMNVNRPFGDGMDNNQNGVVDEIGETNEVIHPSGSTFTFNQSQARSDFARHLYMVALLATERLENVDTNVPQERLDYRRRVAQWAVNVVDFRDRDFINTGFAVDLNPWDGWDVDGDLLNTQIQNGRDPKYREVFWGVERPELLITEVAATHDRATQDLEIDKSGKTTDADEDPDDDFDSHLVPRASVFFELYNPWVINEANQYRPAELYDSALNGVDLQKKSPDGSPVWRMVVTATNESGNVANLNPDNPLQPVTYHRRIYFTQPDDDSGPEVFFPESQIRVPSVQPGFYAVVGSAGVKQGNQYVTYFGRKGVENPLDAEELATTRQIALRPTESQLRMVRWNFTDSRMETITRSQVVTLPIGLNDGGWARSMGVSDPLAGYADQEEDGRSVTLTSIADGFKFTTSQPNPGTDFAYDMPIDQKIDSDHYERYLKNDGLHTAYRTVHLQRLANPIAPYHPLLNPYLTIDSSAIDLLTFNGVESKEDPNNTPADFRFGSYERRAIIDAQGKSTEDITKSRHRLLFKNGREGTRFQKGEQLVNFPSDDQVDEPIGGDSHLFSFNLKESLGRVNDAYRNAIDTSDEPEQFPFAWLTWNNRPFASQLELMNVPFTSSYGLTRFFDVSDENENPYQPGASPSTQDRERDKYSGSYPHLLNFFADSIDDPHLRGGLHRCFDYLEVPSRFLGSESYVNPAVFQYDQGLSFHLAAPFDTISNFRYPGKININTVLDPRVWNGLMANYSEPMGGGTAVSYDEWAESRDGESSPLPFSNPLRSPRAGNWVPTSSLVASSAETGLFRSTERNGRQTPLFDYHSSALHNHTQRAAYFRYDCRQRLGNLVTSRSSVFAIWITVGYFEVDADGNVLDGQNAGRELGTESGEVKRHRGFYIFDRSIPVAFEPGKNHNIDRAVLIRRRID